MSTNFRVIKLVFSVSLCNLSYDFMKLHWRQFVRTTQWSACSAQAALSQSHAWVKRPNYPAVEGLNGSYTRIRRNNLQDFLDGFRIRPVLFPALGFSSRSLFQWKFTWGEKHRNKWPSKKINLRYPWTPRAHEKCRF